MAFSDTVAQQREKQEKGLKRFITYSLAGSFVLHGGFLLLKVHDFWRPEASEQEEIAIVVTEAEEELADVIPPQESVTELEDSGFAGGGGGSGDAGAATIVEAPPAQISAPETPVEEEPVAEEEPEPEPSPVPIEDIEDINDPVAEEPITEEQETPLAEPNEEVAEATPEPRNLSNLLEELRRAREQAGPATVNSNETSGQPTGNGLLEGGDRNSTTAVGTGSGFGDGSDSGTGSGNGEGNGTGSGDGEGNGTGIGSGDGNGTDVGTGSSRGSSSREISCRGCDFDYPESADGAEGTAQVIVETDEQGRVVSVTLSQSSGNPDLDQAALEQARERVRLQGARAGESYPIEIDFVQPGSEAADQAEERGDRTSITVSDPEPELPENTTPSTATTQPPDLQPSISPAADTVTPSTSTLETPTAPDVTSPDVTPTGTVAPDAMIESTPDPATPDAVIDSPDPDSVVDPALEITPEPPPEVESVPSYEDPSNLDQPDASIAPGPTSDSFTEPPLAPESLPPVSLPDPVPLPESAPDPSVSSPEF